VEKGTNLLSCHSGEIMKRRGLQGLSKIRKGVVTSSLVTLLALGTLPSLAGAVTTVTSGTTLTNTYSYTGATETFTVPANVTRLTLTVTGAEGGRGGRDSSGTAPAGGYQGVVTGTISVVPGQVLTIGVGQGGANSPVWNSCSTGANQPTGDPSDAVGGTNPLSGYGGGAGGAPGASGCSGYGGSGGAASVVEIGTAGAPTSVATIVGGGSGGSGGSGQFSPTLGQISLPTFFARPDATTTTGEDGESVYTACHQVTGEQCDGGGGAGGGGGAQGGSAGFVEFGSGTSDEWFGLGGNPGENSTGGLSGLGSQYGYYSDDNANGSVVLSYSTGAPGAPTNVNGAPGNSQVNVYWSAPSSSGDAAISSYAVQYSTSPYSSWAAASMCTGTATSCTVTGLVNGTNYEFRIAAVNSIGQGLYSSPSAPVAPSGPPGAPTITGLTPSDGSLSASFNAATSALPLLDYQYSLDGGVTWVSGGATSSPLVISGLTNGTEYSVELRGVNSAGSGAPSSPVTGTPSALPGAPTITTITPGSDGTSLTVAFVPGYSGGSAITSYQYATSVGAGTEAFGAWTTASGTSSPLTITGLANGTTYSVELRALNTDGAGPGSVYEVGVTLTAPQGPSITHITPGDSTLQITYAPYTSANDGGSPISGIDYSLDGGATWVNAGTLSDPFTISSLTNGTAYNVILRADNGVGSSASSTPASATPRTIPDAPTQVVATGGPSLAHVSWSTPASNGGATVLSYTASAFSTSSGGSAIATCTTSALSCVVAGLTNDTTYYFSVIATNAAGAGAPSNPRVTAEPVALPGAPTISALTAGNSYLAVPFSAGTQDSNNPVTSYQYSTDGGSSWQAASEASSPITISGLTNGTSYTVELRALSASGAGAPSNSEVGMPYAAPDATSNATTSYVAGSGNVTVSWLAPNDNGAAIASYTVTAFSAAVGGTQMSTCTTSSLSCTLGGLSNGTTYYISIQSVNIHSQYSLRSSPLIPVVPGASSTVTLAENPASSTFGQSVTLTATVTTGANGTVNFQAGGATIGSCGAVTVSSGSAQCVTSALAVGTDILQAQYSGNSTYASSTSSSTSFTVGAASQAALSIASLSTTFAPSPHNSATLATTGGSTSGVVTYAVGVSGNSAGCSVTGSLLTYGSSGSCSLVATMAGSADYNPVSSSSTLFTVNQAASSTSLGANPSSSTFGESVTLTATVTTGATGTVNFEAGGATIGSCGAVTVSSGSAQCVTTATPAGSGESLTAVYSGDGNFTTSTSPPLSFDVGQSVQRALTLTSLSGASGTDLTLTSSGGSGTGAVTYLVADGTAACAQPSPGVLRSTGPGTCLVTVMKADDVDYASASSVVTTVALLGSQSLMFTSSAPRGVVVGGTYAPVATSSAELGVVLTIDSSSSSVCTLSGATVTFRSPGVCVIDANQAGNSNYLPASQVQQNVQVGATASATVPSAPLNVTANASGGGVLVSWSTPAGLGTSPIVGYTVSASPGSATCSTKGATSCTLVGLLSTTTYTISVVALDSEGSSFAGTTTFPATGIPSSVPSAPLGVDVSINNLSAVVTWNAPSSDGGSEIVRYEVVASPGKLHCTTNGETSCTVKGLNAGQTYRFSVIAINATGSSARGVSGSSRTAVGQIVVTARFAFDSFALTTADKHALQRLAKAVVNSRIRRLTVTGYADSAGSHVFNDVLSGQRAYEVGHYLFAQVHSLGYKTLQLNEAGRGIRRAGRSSAEDRIVIIEN